MVERTDRAARKGRPFDYLAILCLLLLNTGISNAQRLVSADVQTNQVTAGKKSVVNKNLFCRNDGSFVSHYKSVGGEFYIVGSRLGVTRVYVPQSNEVMTDTQGLFSPKDELLYVFTTGGTQDLGLSEYGFRLKDTRKDDGYIVRNYVATKSGSKCERVEIAYKDFLPVFAAYYDKKDKVITKTYFSQYAKKGTFAFPMRVTEVTYGKEKNDSTVKLDIYSNLKVDVDDPMFHYDVPSDAKTVDYRRK